MHLFISFFVRKIFQWNYILYVSILFIDKSKNNKMPVKYQLVPIYWHIVEGYYDFDLKPVDLLNR